MTFFSDNLSSQMAQKSLTGYRLAIEAKLDSGLLHHILKGKRAPSDAVLEKLATVQELGIPLSRLLAWRAIDEYGAGALREAIAYLDQNPEINQTEGP